MKFLVQIKCEAYGKIKSEPLSPVSILTSVSDLRAFSCLSLGFVIQSSVDLQPFSIPGKTDSSPGAWGLCFLFLFLAVLLSLEALSLALSLSLLISLVQVSPGAAWVRSLYVSAWRTFRMEKKNERMLFSRWKQKCLDLSYNILEGWESRAHS